MMANDLTKGEHVDGEEDGPEDRALRHALVDWGRGRARAVNGDKLCSVGEI